MTRRECSPWRVCPDCRVLHCRCDYSKEARMPALADVLSLVDDETPEFIYTDRNAALLTLENIARTTVRASEIDVSRAGVYTTFVPGWLHILYDLPSRTAWLCDATVDGRLASVQAVARWQP